MRAGERVTPEAAWAASSAAVMAVMGEEPPRGKISHGGRVDPAGSWRRKLALYTAAVSLDVGVKPLLPHASVSRQRIRRVLAEIEGRRDEPAIDALLDLLQAEATRRLSGARP